MNINVYSAADPLKSELYLKKALFPYALLNDDFGILNLNDLALNSCATSPLPFGEDSNAYPYWQCFEVKKVKFWCDPAGRDDNSTAETALLWINVKSLPIPIVYVPGTQFL